MDYRVFPRLYFFLMLVNLGFLMINSGLGITAQTPFGSDKTNVTAQDLPNFYNGTETSLVLNMTGANQTGIDAGGSPISFDWFIDYIEVGLVSLQFLWELVTGGFLNSFITALGFPDYFITVFYSIVGFLAFLWIAYQVLGKG